MKHRAVSATRLEHGRKSASLLPVNHFADFRPGVDTVVIEHGRQFIRDTQGLLADQEVQMDLLTDAQRGNLERTPGALIGMKVQAIRSCPHLSDLGRAQRLEALSNAWSNQYGSATFVVAA